MKRRLWLLVVSALLACAPAIDRARVYRGAVEPQDEALYAELNGIDRKLHREIRRIEGAKRHETPLAQLRAKYDLTPGRGSCPVYFGQASIQPEFSRSGFFKGASLDEVVARVRARELSPDEIPIQFIWVDGKRVAINNRSLAVLYKAGLAPTRLIDQTGRLPERGPDTLESVLRRLEGLGGKPSTEIGIRTRGIGLDGRLKEAAEWDAPIGEYVSMPGELLLAARACREEGKRTGSIDPRPRALAASAKLARIWERAVDTKLFESVGLGAAEAIRGLP